MNAHPKLRPAVFLDRDGTLNVPIVREGKPYPPATVEEFQLFPGVAESCRQLHAAGYVLVVATNQPDVSISRTTARCSVDSAHANEKWGIAQILRVPKIGMQHLHTFNRIRN